MRTFLTGYHAIEERLSSGAIRGILHISRAGERAERLRQRARSVGIEVRNGTDDTLSKLCGRGDHRGFVLESTLAEDAQYTLQEGLAALPSEGPALALVLDGITDPHNLGAILRSADQFAADLVLVPSRRSAQDNDTVARTSAGADSYVPLVVVANLVRALGQLKEAGFWIYGADARGIPLSKADLRGRCALVLGSEGSGIARLARDRCDVLISIPARGHVDSLNVSVAAGILMYEARRQQWGAL